MHSACSRICSFPISIPNYFIRNYTKEGDVVFDSWSGKGTVPFEALRNNRIGIGNDKSPEAYILTHAKVKPITIEALQQCLIKLKRRMSRTNINEDHTELDRNASIFYSKKTFEQVLRLKKVLIGDNSRDAIFTKAIILGLLHGNGTNHFSLPCSHSYSMAPNYVKKYVKKHHLRKPSRNVLECILNRGKALLANPMPNIEGYAFNDDSTNLSLESKSVNMILTSPPYFGIQTYAWANWLRLWFLGYNYKEIKKTLAESGAASVYGNFMKDSINELYRVLKPGGRCFIVVGDVKIGPKKQPIKTAEFLLPYCQDVGFEVEKIVRDTIPSGKRVMTYISENQGIKKERIIYLKKPRHR